MHVFVTGGSGLTGPAIVAELIAAGHTVTGLARSDEAAARLRGLGAETLTGALEDLDTLEAGAKAADGVIHMAFGIPAVSLTPEQAAEHFGDPFMARVFAADAPVSSEASRALLGWTPVHPTLLHDIETGDYCTA